MRPHFVFAFLLLASTFVCTQENAQRRIIRPIDESEFVRLAGSSHPHSAPAVDRGPVSETMPLGRITLFFSRSSAQQAALDQLLVEQHDPASRNYHQWLTPEEFGDRFGMAQADVDIVAAWLRSRGFTVEETARSRTWIAFSGIAAQVSAAFRTPLHQYFANGQLHFAPSVEVAVPVAFSGVIATLAGLDDFRPHANSRMRTVRPGLTSSLSGKHFLVPGDFGTIYNLPDYINGAFQSGLDGSGQVIGIVGQASGSGANSVDPSTVTTDLATFCSASNLPVANLTVNAVGTSSNMTNAEALEADLDVQWAGAVAPNASIVFSYSGNALMTSLPSLVNQNQASVISISYGDCETDILSGPLGVIESTLQQANAQGITVTAAAGDTGATDCDGTPQNPVSVSTHGLAIDYPGSSVYVTAMGGSQFSGDQDAGVVGGAAAATQNWESSSDPNNTHPSAFFYIPEAAWSDVSGGSVNIATGGGASKQFSKPSWQTGAGVPTDGQRDVPDLAFTASSDHDGYITCSQGSCQAGYRRTSDQSFSIAGGTSAASPTFAGIVALANQKLGTRLGNLNPQIYSIAANYAWAYHDITTGDNKARCQTGTPDCAASPTGFSAGAGYDQVTGWGSVDATAFLNALAGTPQPGFDIRPRSHDGVSTADIVSLQGFSGTVTFSCSSNDLPALSCNSTPVTISPNNPAVAGFVAVVDKTVTWGKKTGTVIITGTSGSVVSSVTVPQTVTYQDFTINIVGGYPMSFSQAGPQPEMLLLDPGCVFTQSIVVTCTSDNPQITCSPASTTVNPQACLANTLNFTITNASTTNTAANVTFQGTGGPLTRTTVLPVTVTVPDFVLTMSPVLSVPNGTSMTDSISIASLGGFSSDVALTCSAAPSLGTTTCSISPSTVAGGNGAAQLTVKGAVLARDHGAPLSFPRRGAGSLVTLAFAIGIAFTSTSSQRRKGKKSRRISLFGLLLLSVVGLISCGGGGNSGGGGYTPHTPNPINGIVTVTATGGNVTHTANVNVTVY